MRGCGGGLPGGWALLAAARRGWLLAREVLVLPWPRGLVVSRGLVLMFTKKRSEWSPLFEHRDH